MKETSQMHFGVIERGTEIKKGICAECILKCMTHAFCCTVAYFM